MTVAATPYKESYAGNGVTTVFSVPFYFLADTDLVVSDVNNTTGVITPLVLNVDYTVTGTGTPTGGAVTVTTATATGHTITIERSLVEDQPTHFVDGDPLPAKGLEQALDRIVMLYQQAKTALDRAAKFAVGSPSSSDLPEPQEGYVLGWVSGKLKNLSAATAQLAADLLSTATGKGAALISYLAPYTGAVGRTQQSKNSDELNAKDFGAIADGTWNNTTHTASGTDNLAAFNAALAAAVSAKISKVRASGVFHLSGKLTVPHGVTLVGDGMAHLPLFIGGTVSGTVLLIDGIAGSDCIAVAENAGRAGLRDISIYNTNANAIRSVCAVVGHLYPQFKNVEVTSLRQTTGVGWYLAPSATGAAYETLWGDFDNCYATGTDYGLATECSVKWGLWVHGLGTTSVPNANSFRAGQFAGYFGGALFDGAVSGSGPLSCVFHGTKFDLVWDTASHYTPQYQALASGVFGAGKANCYIVPVVQILKGFETVFNGCYFESASVPATYNDGTHGALNLYAVAWIDAAAECIGNEFTGCNFNSCFLYDIGAKSLVSPTVDGRRHDTRIIPHLSLVQTTFQAVVAYGWTKLTGLTVEFGDDSYLEYDSSANLIKVRSAGTYMITGAVEWAGWAVAATIYGQTRIIAGGYTKNGNAEPSNGAATPFSSQISAVVNLAMGDTIEWDVFQNQGTNQNTAINNTRLSVVKIA